jgi:hypothetical protein
MVRHCHSLNIHSLSSHCHNFDIHSLSNHCLLIQEVLALLLCLLERFLSLISVVCEDLGSASDGEVDMGRKLWSYARYDGWGGRPHVSSPYSLMTCEGGLSSYEDNSHGR